MLTGATKKQKQIIHILEHQLIEKGLLDSEGYRLVLRGLFGRESSKELSHTEASHLIDQLVKMGGQITSVARHGLSQGIPAHIFSEEGSLEGLRNEVVLLAKERYGEDFKKPLAALCRRLEIDDYTAMDVRHAKAVKETLLRLLAKGPYVPKKNKRAKSKEED